LNLLVAGCGETFDRIGIDVAQKVTAEFVNKRTQFKKSKLRFRASGGAKRALGWVPFKAVNIRQKGNSLTFLGKRIRLFNAEYYTHHRKGAIKVCEGSFSQTALGDWYLNQVMAVAFAPLPALSPSSKVGMDPGKDIALSTGEKLVYGFYREKEAKIAELQKRAHKKQCKYVHKKVANQRLNHQHQDTSRLIREHGEIYLGDNSVARMKQKQGSIAMGKSISDNAIGQFKTLLHYKGHWAGRKVVLVSERYTTQACSNCGLRTGPRGLRQLVVRNWVCEACEASHDRDVNAAMNMLHSPLSAKNTSFQPRNGLPFAGTRCVSPQPVLSAKSASATQGEGEVKQKS
jgi:putative transposase